MQSFICPDCRAEHDEPAEAAYVLYVRCLDCALHVEYAARIVAVVLAEAA